jgi:hypothetical protein
VYATVEALRAEGVRESEGSDERLLSLLAEATASIDRFTGWYFEPRRAAYVLDGRGTPTIELPVPPIQLDHVQVGSGGVLLPPSALVVVGAPVLPGFDVPRITRRHGLTFPRGQGNVVAAGLWGFTEDDGTPLGRTPPAIRRACMLLALRGLAPLNDEASQEARMRWRIVEERTREQSYRLEPIGTRATALTGEPEIDALLRPYIRPKRMGAA